MFIHVLLWNLLLLLQREASPLVLPVVLGGVLLVKPHEFAPCRTGVVNDGHGWQMNPGSHGIASPSQLNEFGSNNKPMISRVSPTV